MRLSTYILSLALFFTLIQCGGEDALSKNVDVDVTPVKPLVQNSDVIIPIGSADATVTITAPFISIGLSLGNSSGSPLVVTGFRLEASYDLTDEKTGVTTTSTSTADIGTAAFSADEVTIKSSVACNFIARNCDQNVFAALNSGETGFVLQGYPSTGGNPSDLRFYFSSLPKNDSKNFVYRIKLSVLGYFGTATNITGRVNKSIYFTTF